MNKRIAAVIGILLLNCGCSFAQHSQYRMANKFPIEGNGGWDYITTDDAAGRLFVSHSTVVQIVDVRDGKVIGTIPDTKGVHGIALADDLNRGFVSCGKDSSVTVFSLKTLDGVAKVKVTGNTPDAILYDPFSHRVFTFNGGSANATVIDARTNQVIETIALAGKPEYAVADGKGKVFVNIEDKNAISMINATTLKVEHTWAITPGEEPTGLAIDIVNHRLFAVCGNKLMVVADAETGKVIATLPIGERADGVVYDADKKRAYSSNGEGTITVVQEENENVFRVIETITTQRGARTIALDSKTHRLYLPTADYIPPGEPTAENPKPRAKIKPDSFVILEVELLK
jgi:YVTN family beta-propeller protein